MSSSQKSSLLAGRQIPLNNFESLQEVVRTMFADIDLESSDFFEFSVEAKQLVRLLELWEESRGTELLLGALARLNCRSPEAVFELDQHPDLNDLPSSGSQQSETIEACRPLYRSYLGAAESGVRIAAAHLLMQLKSAGEPEIWRMQRILQEEADAAARATVAITLGVVARRCSAKLRPQSERGLAVSLSSLLTSEDRIVRFGAACGLAFLRRPLGRDQLLEIVRGSLNGDEMPEQWHWFDAQLWCNSTSIGSRLLSWVSAVEPEPSLEYLMAGGNTDPRVLLHLGFYAGEHQPSISGISLSELSRTQYAVLRTLSESTSTGPRELWNEEEVLGLGLNPARLDADLDGFLKADTQGWMPLDVAVGNRRVSWPSRRIILSVAKGEIGIANAAAGLVSGMTGSDALEITLRTHPVEKRLLKTVHERQRLQDLCKLAFESRSRCLEEDLCLLESAAQELEAYTLADLQRVTWHPGRVRTLLCDLLAHTHGVFPSEREPTLLKAINDAWCEQPLRSILSALPCERLESLLKSATPRGRIWFWDLSCDVAVHDEAGEFLSQANCRLSFEERVMLLSRAHQSTLYRWRKLESNAKELFHVVRQNVHSHQGHVP